MGWVGNVENCVTPDEMNLPRFAVFQVLRPHGVCANQEGDLFIIDTAIDSMEVFQFDGTFSQTLLPSDDGVLIKPKVSPQISCHCCFTSPDISRS